MKKLFVLAAMLSVMLLSGCASHNMVKELSDVTQDEIIVIGKFNIAYNGEDVTERTSIVMSRRDQLVGPYLPHVPDAQGYVYGRFPKGKRITVDSLLLRAGALQGHMGHPGKDDVYLEVQGDGPFYMGDLTVTWMGPSAAASILAVEPYMLIRNKVMRKDLDIDVTSNLQAAQDAFNKKFNTNAVLKESLATVIKRENPKPIE